MIPDTFLKWFELMRERPCWGKGGGTGLMSSRHFDVHFTASHLMPEQPLA